MPKNKEDYGSRPLKGQIGVPKVLKAARVCAARFVSRMFVFANMSWIMSKSGLRMIFTIANETMLVGFSRSQPN